MPRARQPAFRRMVVWTSGLLALYLLLISTVTGVEVAVGAALAVVMGWLAVAAASALHSPGRVRRLAWRHTLWIPVDVVTELFQLATFLARYVRTGGETHGVFVEQQLPDLPDNEAAALRAYTVGFWSLTPGSYVVDIWVEGGRRDVVRRHQLVRPSRSGAVVPGAERRPRP